MARRIMILCGSPRASGNTNTVVGWFAQGATAAGAEVEKIDLAKLKLKGNGCLCCMGCQKSDTFECVVKDGAQPILARMPEADVLVFATPVYFFGPTAQLKLVMDRMYSLYKYAKSESFDCAIRHATLVLISTAADGMDGGLGLLAESFETMAKFNGSRFEKFLVPNAPKETSELASNAALRSKAVEFGRRIAEG
ncbi:MAG: flavodoxin family protein [Phycisphaerae bacterium]